MSSLAPSLARTLTHGQRYIPMTWRQGTIIREMNLTEVPASHLSEEHRVSHTDSDPPIKDYVRDDTLLLSIQTFTSHGELSKAFQAFSLLQLHLCGYSSPSYSLHLLHPISMLLVSCSNLKASAQGKQLHAYIINLGFEQNPVLVPKLITFYTTFGNLIDAHTVTENSNVLHSMPWNLLISAYVKSGSNGKAISAYKQMLEFGIRPDNYTYPSVLKACADEYDLALGKELHRSIENSHHEWSLFVQNALVSMYSKCGEVGSARTLFDKMPEKDVVSWNSIISGYASKGLWDDAFDLFERMRSGNTDMNIITWNTIAGGCLQTGNYKGALDLLSQMRNNAGYVDPVSMVIGLGACSRIGNLKLGKEIHGSAVRGHLNGFETVKNSLITMYSRCKDLRHAYILFRSTEVKSLITWNSMIAAYTHFDQSEEASFIFREMMLSGAEPNYVTIASILPLCARVANLQHGKELHCYITRRQGFKNYLLLWNSLVDMYCKSGKISEAKRLFDLMNEKDEVTYTSLIAGYGMQGDGQTALKLFEEMKSFRITPDHVTMVAALFACSHSGLVSQGEKLFKQMISFYRIRPRMEHFACMVDLFGRAGLLERAAAIIRKMPFPPSPPMWATLLGACQIHRNTDIGEWAAEKLLEMRPDKSGYYVLIANMYAAARCWSKLAEVRTLMRDSGVRKTPGCAWIDVGSGFQLFLVGDRSSLLAQEIYKLLDGMTKLMKEDGYVATDEFGFASEDLASADHVVTEVTE